MKFLRLEIKAPFPVILLITTKHNHLHDNYYQRKANIKESQPSSHHHTLIYHIPHTPQTTRFPSHPTNSYLLNTYTTLTIDPNPNFPPSNYTSSTPAPKPHINTAPSPSSTEPQTRDSKTRFRRNAREHRAGTGIRS